MTTFSTGLQARLGMVENVTLKTVKEVLHQSPKAVLAGAIAYSYTRWYALIPAPKMTLFNYIHKAGTFANGANPLHAATFAAIAYLIYLTIRPTYQTILVGTVNDKQNTRSLESTRWNNIVIITNALAMATYVSHRYALLVSPTQGIGLSIIAAFGIWLSELR